MIDKPRNNWRSKIKRAVTGVLPVSKNRRGKCKQCGACCHLPAKCPFLITKPGNGRGNAYSCRIYKVRFQACRKYPRTKSEWLTQDTCGFWFELHSKLH